MIIMVPEHGNTEESALGTTKETRYYLFVLQRKAVVSSSVFFKFSLSLLDISELC